MKTIDLIASHEGYRKRIYKCTAGYNTIGYGFNLDAGMSEEEARLLLEFRIAAIQENAAWVFSWYRGLNNARRAAIVDMIYNLGMTGFLEFRKTIQFMESRDHILAAEEMLDSKWATQVGNRALNISEMISTGEWPEGYRKT
jgi:lysozyme